MCRKILFFLCILSVSGLGARGTVHVLCYHTFMNRKTDYDVAPEEFKKQIDDMASMGYRFVKTEDVMSGRVNGNNNVWITIDDGNNSINAVYNNALKPHGVKPLLFLYPGILDRKSVPYALSYAEIKGFLNDGASAGAHGFYHLFLNEKQYKKDKKEFLKEIYGSRDTLESKLGRKMELFAYPFGVYSDLARDELAQAGFKYAFTINHGVVQVPLELNPEPLKLPRYLVTKTSWKNVRSILSKNLQKSKKS